MERITIIGTGLIGTSIALALRESSPKSEILGFDANPAESAAAYSLGALHAALRDQESALASAARANIIVLAVPVFAILDWMPRLAAVTKPGQLVTDTGSTKLQITHAAQKLFTETTAAFLPGHPMAGKESGGAALAEAALFRDAMWLFTPAHAPEPPAAARWRSLVLGFGARTTDLDADRHDRLCAWVSHMPQMVSTALSALLLDEFGDDPALRAIGGRALREMTRLGASPYSMWRDVALSNTAPLADTLSAVEQRLAHLRENLRTPELRTEFRKANRFRATPDAKPDKKPKAKRSTKPSA